MPTRTRRDEYRKIAEDFLKRAKSAPTEEERADFLDMARAIERAGAKVKPMLGIANDYDRAADELERRAAMPRKKA